MFTKTNERKYLQKSLLQKVFTKTNLAIAAIMVSAYIAVLVLGNFLNQT